jgi:homoserine dehydrogenase
MARTHCSYAEALADAQRLGYAEADPTDDVNEAKLIDRVDERRPAKGRRSR